MWSSFFFFSEQSWLIRVCVHAFNPVSAHVCACVCVRASFLHQIVTVDIQFLLRIEQALPLLYLSPYFRFWLLLYIHTVYVISPAPVRGHITADDMNGGCLCHHRSDVNGCATTWGLLSWLHGSILQEVMFLPIEQVCRAHRCL